MEEKDKELLHIDLSARLPYRTKVTYHNRAETLLEVGFSYCRTESNVPTDFEYIKPYLRPISSLTQEERDKFCDIGGVISHRPDGKLYLVAYFPEALDYLNSIHADYRGMIEKGLAIEVTDENNPYK